jgi:excisionase family DNA binding protein
MLDVHGAAERLGISKWAVWRLCRAGKLPYYRWYRGAYRFDSFEIEIWKQEHRGGPQTPPMKVRRADISK